MVNTTFEQFLKNTYEINSIDDLINQLTLHQHNAIEYSINIPVNITPNDIILYFQNNQYEYELDCNGWQHDFWIYIYKGDFKDKNGFILNGCWYYDNFSHLTLWT